MHNEIDTPGMGFVPMRAHGEETVRLSMQQLYLTGQVLPAGARLLVRHSFRSSEPEPAEVVYCFALPRDAALRRFRVAGDGFSVRSELKTTAQAVESYEAAMEARHLGVLARQYEDGLINLAVGNLRPSETVTVWLEILAGVELRDDGLRFRFPFTLAPSYHAKARVAVIEEGVAEVELPEEGFGDLLLPRFHADAHGLHEIGFDLTVNGGGGPVEIGSPSHTINIREAADGSRRVRLAAASDVPDRDLVLDVRTPDEQEKVIGGATSDGRRHFAVLVPSGRFGEAVQTPRSVVFLLDRSGSMSGKPIQQARKALAACLSALNAEDRFGLVAFDSVIETFAPALMPATLEHREQAGEFLAGIDARGGTELAAGVEAAVELLKGGEGELFVLTDGQVYGAGPILARAKATGIRLHCLGIGSASQDRFLGLLARETGGISRFVTPRERVDAAALELFASASRPVVNHLKVIPEESADIRIEPNPPKMVFSGTPLVLWGECGSPAGGAIVLQWDSGSGTRRWRISLEAEDNQSADTVRLLRGARLITDLEARFEGETETGKLAKRHRDRITKKLEALSTRYGLASRAMSLVAVVERAGDHPGEPPKTVVVPVGLPQDEEFEGVFGPPPPMAAVTPRYSVDFSADRTMEVSALATPAPLSRPARRSRLLKSAPPVSEPEDETFKTLLDLVARLEADGGMPGDTEAERILATVHVLLALATGGGGNRDRLFRLHIRKMEDFLRRTLPDSLTREQEGAVRAAMTAVHSGGFLKAGPQQWLEWAANVVEGRDTDPARGWTRLVAAFGGGAPRV